MNKRIPDRGVVNGGEQQASLYRVWKAWFSNSCFTYMKKQCESLFRCSPAYRFSPISPEASYRDLVEHDILHPVGGFARDDQLCDHNRLIFTTQGS